ncbi:hypothetical protein C4K68_03665 [Pokkaliibacter plantistimulans]|uniref:Uncharacterized protein n=1 Tax=Proteobacteria bacterium 228 TaxID=2083153 RepID=A0A2S5KUS9_9PROT|nr:hypothetical protein [Pokkaliibacter plantistimulans]PPC78617.1 hypothetical protein C4K68_03665 [Pokkaliibacter plantistimulans]
MALNLDKLIKAHQFRFETEALGELLCNNFSMSVMSEAGKWLSGNEKKDSVEFARYFTTLLCQPVDKEKDKDCRINEEQAKLLTQSDLEDFAKLFIEKNGYLLDDKDKQETIRKKDDEGKVVVSLKNHTADELLKKSDESETEHLLRVVDLYIAQSSKRTKELFDSAMKGLFSSSTLGLLEENKRISNSLGSSLIHHQPFKLPELPENPVFETNRQLASFGKELNAVAALIKNMNDLGVQMAMDSAAATARTKLWNNIMFGLGLITLVVTAIFSYLSYASSNDSSSHVESLLVEQNTLLEIQEKNQKELIKALSSIPPVLERFVVQNQDQEKILHGISVQLNNITSQSSSQPSAARTPKSGASD